MLSALSDMVRRIIKKAGIARASVYEMVIAGNTAMNHLMLRIPVDTLAVSPYQPVFTSLAPLPSQDLGFPIHPNGNVHVVPNIKSFVGGDIAAGIAAVDMGERKGNFLLIDLGTNGEIVLKKGSEFTATSTLSPKSNFPAVGRLRRSATGRPAEFAAQGSSTSSPSVWAGA
jgi:uncharacterized 2Fe-2S/4Fe-4S cluster protein (DUF4445 family)